MSLKRQSVSCSRAWVTSKQPATHQANASTHSEGRKSMTSPSLRSPSSEEPKMSNTTAANCSSRLRAMANTSDAEVTRASAGEFSLTTSVQRSAADKSRRQPLPPVVVEECALFKLSRRSLAKGRPDHPPPQARPSDQTPEPRR